MTDMKKQTDQSKNVLRNWVEELNKSNIASLEEIIHHDFIDHNPFPGMTADKKGYVAMLTTAHKEWFNGIQIKIEDMVGEGDKVAVRLSVTAKHTGPALGSVPSGKDLSWDAYAIYRIKDNMVYERWEMLDSLSFFVQLGLAQMANPG